ncbi:11531_t:CDS:2, partial [Racocetra persica]
NYHNFAYDIKRFDEQCQQKYGDISEIMLDRTEELGMYGHGIIFNEELRKSANQLFKELSGYWQPLGSQNTSKKNNNNWILETDFSH